MSQLPTEVEADRMAVLEMQKSRADLRASHRENHFRVPLRRTLSRAKAFSDGLFNFSWLLVSSEGRILLDVHGQESLCDFGMCTPVFYGAKWRLLCIDRCMCLDARTCVYTIVCMTLFVSPGSPVGWVTVRGTGPEQRNQNPPRARIWIPPCHRRG